MNSGAGGNWKRIGEKKDLTIVKQTSGASCVSAAGEMLLSGRGVSVAQSNILKIIGEPATASGLARVLNQYNDKETERWHGVATDDLSLDVLLRRANWAVFMRESGSSLGHAVTIDGATKAGLIKIKDPFDQPSNKMKKEDFLDHWGGEVIFYGTTK